MRKCSDKNAIALGNTLLKNALGEYDICLQSVLKKNSKKLLTLLGFPHFNDLFSSVAMGYQPARLIAFRMASELLTQVEFEAKSSLEKPLVIVENESLLVSFSKCCYPIPGRFYSRGHNFGKRLIYSFGYMF